MRAPAAKRGARQAGGVTQGGELWAQLQPLASGLLRCVAEGCGLEIGRVGQSKVAGWARAIDDVCEVCEA